MYRSLQQLARAPLHISRRTASCSTCRNSTALRSIATASRNPSITTRTTTSRSLLLSHPTARLSTSSVSRSIKQMTQDSFDEAADETTEQIKTTSIAATSASTSAAAPETKSQGDENEFLDPTIIPPEPIKAFRDLYEEVRYSTNPDDHERLLSAYRALADDPDLLSQMQPVDFMYAMNICRDLLHVVARMRRILEDVNKTPYAEIPELYHILLKTHIKMSDFISCGNLIDKMRQRNIKFNTATYHVLLDICKHERKLKNAVGLLGQMRKRGVEVTETTYLIMLTICARVKDARRAKEFFDEMPLEGLDQAVTHYNALLNAFAQAQDLEGARRVFEMMEDDGIQADQYTYTAMVKVLMAHERSAEANALISGLAARGVKPNAKVLAAIGMEPLEILNECTTNGVPIAQHDFNMLIIQALKKNLFTQVPNLIQQMQEYGHRPNVYTFTAMIDADIKMGKYEEAKDVFQAMQQANIQPDVIAYSAMISGALSQASVKESMEILKAMVGDGVLPNLHTFNSLLSASVGEIGIDSFKTIRDTMQALHVRPDQRSFNALLSAYALQGDMDEMLGALDDMKQSRVAPDALTYSILISGFLQNGDLRYAMEWYYKMMDGGFIPATFVINNLMAALHGSGQGQQVLIMWREMDRLRIKKNEQSFEIALEACEKFGLHDALPQIEEELKTYLVRPRRQ